MESASYFICFVCLHIYMFLNIYYEDRWIFRRRKIPHKSSFGIHITLASLCASNYWFFNFATYSLCRRLVVVAGQQWRWRCRLLPIPIIRNGQKELHSIPNAAKIMCYYSHCSDGREFVTHMKWSTSQNIPWSARADLILSAHPRKCRCTKTIWNCHCATKQQEINNNRIWGKI